MGMKGTLAIRRRARGQPADFPPGSYFHHPNRTQRAERGAGKKSKKKQESLLEQRFDLLWKSLAGQPLEKEVQLVPGRKFRFDRCHTASRVAVEIHGGTWIGGRHVQGTGFHSDRVKRDLAEDEGWKVYELCGEDINVEMLGKIMRKIAERMK